jgi:hypothetical protein
MRRNGVIQVEASEDGCLYVYSFATGLWAKVSRIASFNALPRSVKDRLRGVVNGAMPPAAEILSEQELQALTAALNAGAIGA